MHVDGSSPNIATGGGVVLITPEKAKLEYAIRFGFKATNNEAKYESMITGLCLACKLRAKKIKVRSDSQLVVGQVQGEYVAKDDRMKQYLAIVEKDKSQFRHFIIQQVPWGDNEDADRLAKHASSASENLALGVMVEHLPQPSIKVKEDKKINMTSPELGWATQIIRYLKDGQLPEDKKETRKIMT